MTFNENNQNKISINQKYKKILNDLLNISHNDSCIFSKIDNTKMFDIEKKFGDNFFKKILDNPTFFIDLTETDNKEFIRDINNCKSIEQIKDVYEEYNENIPEEISNKLNLKKEQNLEPILEQIVKISEVNRQKNSFKWKKLLTKAKEMNEQNNLWPLHLGFVYITLRIENKVVQAPIFLKEINIKIKNSKVSIISVGDIKINEKLIYFLEANKYLFDLDFDYSKMSIGELYEIIKKSWSQNLVFPESLMGFVPNFKQDEIQNETIQFWPGISLGFFEPTGGHLRKIVSQILERNLLDNLIEVEFDKNIYKNLINETIQKQNFGFFKIVHSNLSQDKAVVSALNQNTIIWGPPGTGKSQTITNILTNILMYQKTAVVVSQKKAALEVLKSRMKSLEMFCLFILNDKEMNKKSFYNPIREYIEYLENFNDVEQEDILEVISKEEKAQMKQVNKILQQPNALENMFLYSTLTQREEYNESLIDAIQNLDEAYQYNLKELQQIKPKKRAKFLMTLNNLKKPNIFVGATKEIKKSTQIINENLLNSNFDLDYFVSQKNMLNKTLLNEIDKLSQMNFLGRNDVNDDKKLKKQIANVIFNKLKAYDDEKKIAYNNFALDVRTGSLEPMVFIKKHINILKDIYQIIITTPETDLQTWDEKEFDYALLDESSQIFLEKGLPILYLAKIKILAGDDQQMQPSRWFAAKVEGENPFGNIESLLDYGIAKGMHAILLDKNYRSTYASLMTFNSQVFYKGELDVVDVKNNNKINPIDVINVEGVWENSQNDEELKIVIEQTLQNLDKYKKIIILCFNSSQQNALETIILKEYPELENAINREQILVRNIENIQGDEADLLIVSIAYDKNTKLHSTYVAKPGGKNALNVATSRAKDKMIIIKSINSEDIQNQSNSEDIAVFKEWLRFLDLTEEQKKEYVFYKNENKENIINESTREILVDENINKLIQKITNDLNNLITDFSQRFVVEINYSIGTMKIPFAILDKNNGNYVCGLYLDTFQYWKSYKDFIQDKDVEKFFKMKKYNLFRINILNWNNCKIDVSKQITDYIDQQLKSQNSNF